MLIQLGVRLALKKINNKIDPMVKYMSDLVLLEK